MERHELNILHAGSDPDWYHIQDFLDLVPLRTRTISYSFKRDKASLTYCWRRNRNQSVLLLRSWRPW